MAWWRKLLGLESQPNDHDEGASHLRATKPPLVLLTSDTAGLAALTARRFDDVVEAAEYIGRWNHRTSGGTVYPFWALPGKPGTDPRSPSDERGEPIVLIKDEEREGVVYPFSFSDMMTALMFVRQEITSGLQFDRIFVYWAVPVKVTVDGAGRTVLNPGAPPQISSETPVPEAPRVHIDTKTRFVRNNDAKETAPNSIQREDEIRRWVPHFPVVSHRVETLELHPNSVGEVEDPPDVAPVTPEKINGAPIAMEQNGTSNGTPVEEPTVETTESKDDHEEQAPEIDDDDVLGDMRRILRWRRLDQHDGPFEGFDSPQGRF
jgi:hypothetical protein